MTTKKYHKNLNDVILKGKVVGLRVFEGTYPMLSVFLNMGGESDFRITIGLNKEKWLYKNYTSLEDKVVVVVGSMDSWVDKKTNELNYSLRATEGGINMVKDGSENIVNQVTMLGEVKKCVPWKDGFISQIGMRYSIPNKKSWADRYARVFHQQEVKEGATVWAMGSVVRQKNSVYVEATTCQVLED